MTKFRQTIEGCDPQSFLCQVQRYHWPGTTAPDHADTRFGVMLQYRVGLADRQRGSAARSLSPPSAREPGVGCCAGISERKASITGGLNDSPKLFSTKSHSKQLESGHMVHSVLSRLCPVDAGVMAVNRWASLALCPSPLDSSPKTLLKR